MSVRSELIALLGKPPEHVVRELLAAGLPYSEIAEKLEVSRSTVVRWSRPFRERLVAAPHDYRNVTPDGSPLKAWMATNGITSITARHVIRRMNLGWGFFEAVYTEVRHRPATGGVRHA